MAASFIQLHCIINPVQDGLFRGCSRMGINLIGLIYESEKKITDAHAFSAY